MEKGGCLDASRRQIALATKQILAEGSDAGGVGGNDVVLLVDRKLDHSQQVVLQVFAHVGVGVHDGDLELVQLLSRAHAAQEEDLGRLDRT